jgi:hypothetical protein
LSEYPPVDYKQLSQNCTKTGEGITDSENPETGKTLQQPKKTDVVSENLMGTIENWNPVSPPKSNMTLKAHDDIQYKMSQEDENWTKAIFLSRASKTTGNNRNWYNVQDIYSKGEKSLDIGRLPWERIDLNHDNDECVHSASC